MQWDCQWSLKNGEKIYGSCEPTTLCNRDNPNLLSNQPITKGQCQPITADVSYHSDSPTATRLGLCISLLNSLWWSLPEFPGATSGRQQTFKAANAWWYNLKEALPTLLYPCEWNVCSCKGLLPDGTKAILPYSQSHRFAAKHISMKLYS